MTTHLGQAHVLRGDARALPLPDDSVDLIISSPPYFALRSYQDGGEHYDGQIGSEPTPQEFVDALIAVTRECVRVLKPSGSLWINLGDKYSTGNSGQSGMAQLGEQYRGGGHTQARAMTRSGRVEGLPPKTLLGVPWRYALRCVDELGLILRAEVVWDKPNGMPESVTDRVRRSHEQWFHFTIAPNYFSAVDEVREPHAAWTLKAYAYEQANDYKRRANADRVDQGNAKDYAVANPLGKIPGSVRTVASEPLSIPDRVAHATCCGGDARPGCENGIDHFAAFPSAWPKWIIRGWAPLTGVCTVCGEGRRPVSEAAYAARNGGDRHRPAQIDTKNAQGGGHNVSGYPHAVRSTTITGYVCGCNDVIRTPTGRALAGPTGSRPTGDPSKVIGRAGMARERADGAGTRDISRWEQQHEARQLRAADPRAQEHMRDEAGPAYAHYTRTDRAGARPVPETLRTHWRQQGWLTPAPPFEAPPTTPAVVLDPFGGTGTVAMVAKAFGMTGITVDLSADYCRLATWRTTDRDQLAKVLGIAKPTGAAAAEALAGHDDLFSLMEEA